MHLRTADPNRRIVVLDRSGRWLAAWSQQFARAGIDRLRSPVVHHPAPDPFALTRFIDDHGLERSGTRYDLPLSAVFATFCDALVAHAELDQPTNLDAHRVRSDGLSLQIETRDETISARHLIVAANPHRRSLPDWIWPALGSRPGLVSYGADVDLRTLTDLRGERIAIIGGGMTAGHLAIGAAARRGDVQLISRRALRPQDFDTAPGWLGPKLLAAFNDEPSALRRIAIAQDARNGGSMPPWMHARLANSPGPGAIRCRESTTVERCDLHADSGCTLTFGDGTTTHVDRVWLATGTEPDARALRCVRDLLDDVPMHDGLPLTSDTLRLGPHPVFVMGRLAMSMLGPASGNLWGAQRAAHRITLAITGVDVDCISPRPIGSL